ncbi:MAG: TrkH family potassium uptake protein [Thermoplasmata archaeon]
MMWKYSKKDACLVMREMGNLLLIVSVVLLIPLLTAYIYGESDVYRPFIYSAVISALSGTVLRLMPTKGKIEKRHAISLVVLAWPIVSFPSALPFYFINPGPENITYLDAYFEAISGWTTTGLTTFGGNADGFLYSVNLWRHLLQFLGGLGIIVMGVVVLSPVKKWEDKMELMFASGNIHRITPSLNNTIKLISGIYLALMLGGTFLYVISGLSLFDALCHSMAGFSTGGFSTRSDSIMAYGSASVTFVSLPIMIIGGTNFVLIYFFFSKKIKHYIRDIETKVFWSILSLFTILSCLFYIFTLNGGNILFSFEANNYIGVLDTVFMIVSALTTTGWNSIPYASWSAVSAPLVFVLIVVAMIVGANTSSTGGGLKAARVGIMFKSILWQIENMVLPKTAIVKKRYRHLESKIIDDEELVTIFNYFFIYLIVLSTSFVIFLLFGQELLPSLFEITSAIGTVGLSSGVTSLNLNPLLKIVLIINMWLGRIEVLPVFYLLKYMRGINKMFGR